MYLGTENPLLSRNSSSVSLMKSCSGWTPDEREALGWSGEVGKEIYCRENLSRAALLGKGHFAAVFTPTPATGWR